MERKILIGTVSTNEDIKMTNLQFQYAASFERLLVPKGEYPIYCYADDIKRAADGKKRLGWRNYIGFTGTVIDGNVGGKPGEITSYHEMWRDYELAQKFLDGHDYIGISRLEFRVGFFYGGFSKYINSIDSEE